MEIEYLFEKLNLEKNSDDLYDFWGNSFQMNISGFQIETFEQRIDLLNKATEIEHQRLINDEDSWAITGFKKLNENWKEFDFEYGKEMLFNAIRYDLAYSNSERMSLENARKFHHLIMSDYEKKNTFIYCNYDKSPWDKSSGGYGGWNLTDDWTFDIGIILINSHKLTFNYFLSED
ncbi:hypothetical protein [Aquimarina sp. MMG016]|uniref:hypothetical protein n=1 Tax=Aquimarina sp. MMG016 TaxID=2822690 RepID=UPI001B3A1ECD|nr:hypothetical protein [Aquimarina sp. MMG016]MBQ4822366.1 hypothetical protein [Aquimarina sp. MMG016]